MFPTGGEDGWRGLGVAGAEEPVTFPLPVPYEPIYWDPAVTPPPDIAAASPVPVPTTAVLAGGGEVRAAVGLTAGGEPVMVAMLRQLNTWNVTLLDSLDVPEVLARCAIQLTVYEEDRTTPRWAASTDPLHPFPYLQIPESYASQDLDIATGAVSIGTLTLGVLDPATVPGDQDSGRMTARLAWLGLPDLAGRRARVVLGLGETSPPLVLADGPLSAVVLGDYARFDLTVRDTRETERRSRITGGGSDTAILPFGPFNGYGIDPALPSGYLTGPISERPLLATFVEGGIDPALLLPYDFDNPLGPRRVGSVDVSANELTRVLVPIAAWREAGGINTNAGSGFGEDVNLTLLAGAHRIVWRPAASSDPWTEVTRPFIWGGVVLCGGIFGPCPYEPYPDALDPTHFRVNFFTFSGDELTMPADAQAIEVVVLLGRGEISEALPFYLEGLTLGEFLRRAYDGEFSPRGPQGEVRPTGIRYDPDALLPLTDPVRLRLTAPVDDLRAWLESHGYGPSGWTPAPDGDGRVSPVYQGAPAGPDGLTLVHNGITEPSSEWNSGERIVNVIRFRYYRDYRPGDQVIYAPYNVLRRDIVIEYRDEPSITRHGEQVLNLETDIFTAVGLPEGEPLAAGQVAELGFQLAAERAEHLLNRYSLGAMTFRVNVLRSASPSVRAGSWVVVDLSWLPDYVTRRRGLVALAQVVGLNDLDCYWRGLTLEAVVPLELPPS